MPDSGRNEPEALWGYDEVAEYLGLSPKTVKQWAKMRKIPVVKVGSLNRFRPAAIREWARSREVPAVKGAE